MDYGSSDISKYEYSKLLAASFAYILIKQQDAVGLALFDEQINKLIPPKSIPSHLNILLSHMEQSKPGSKTNIAQALLKDPSIVNKSKLEALKKENHAFIEGNFMTEEDVKDVVAAAKWRPLN